MDGTKVKILVGDPYSYEYALCGEVISNVYSSTSTQYSGVPRSGDNYSNTSSVECVVVKLDNGEIVRDVPICRLKDVMSFSDLLGRYDGNTEGWW